MGVRTRGLDIKAGAADAPPAHQPRQAFLTVAEWQAAEVLIANGSKRVQHSLADGAAAVQGVEDRDAVGSADDCALARVRIPVPK
jgi:hypothetical protein